MQDLVPLIIFKAWTVLGLLALVITYKILTGSINMHGLLDDKMTGELSPGRVQLLVNTMIGAGYYLLLAIEQASSGSLPAIPVEVPLLVGTSQFIYLGAKARSHLLR